MKLKYAISLWNYYHYSNPLSLERTIEEVRREGYGIEIWGAWQEETNLYDETVRGRLTSILRNMTTSVHTANVKTFEDHRMQIDAAAEWGARVIVFHKANLDLEGTDKLDTVLCRDIVAYAGDRQVKVALENGPLSFLSAAIEKVDDLSICLDVGHVYNTPEPMSSYLATLKERLIHVHIQDILPSEEKGVTSFRDHYIPGTGGIPQKDWELVLSVLNEINFEGVAVFEIRPRKPLQTALIARKFLSNLLPPV